jgi:hypothetical protein
MKERIDQPISLETDEKRETVSNQHARLTVSFSVQRQKGKHTKQRPQAINFYRLRPEFCSGLQFRRERYLKMGIKRPWANSERSAMPTATGTEPVFSHKFDNNTCHVFSL